MISYLICRLFFLCCLLNGLWSETELEDRWYNDTYQQDGWALGQTAEAANANFTPKFIESEQSLFNIQKDQEYVFGYLEVLEDRSAVSGRTIQLPVYIFKSRSKNPKKDPILYTVGGPGYSTMPSAQYMKYYSYLDDRDFILFEQRGNFYAKPHLGCPEWGQASRKAQNPSLTEEEVRNLMKEAAVACRSRLVEQGVNLDAYHTNAIAADIEDLRKALRIDQWNLLTISYSTKIAQVLMRDYPEGIRSVVMDSPLPLEVSYDEESVQNLLEAYDHLFADCEADPTCRLQYPDLKERFFHFLEEKTRNPLKITVADPKGDREVTFQLRGEDLASLFNAVSVSELPQMMEEVMGNDQRLIKEGLTSYFQEPGSGTGIGMRLSVWCAEETPFADRVTIRKETEKYPAIQGLSPVVFDPEVCDAWGVKSLDEKENQPVVSSIPTLLISGSYDNETPVKWARQMRTRLKNSFHLVFKGWRHTPTTNWGNSCAMEMANAFFNKPDQKPDLSCFREIKGPVFDLD